MAKSKSNKKVEKSNESSGREKAVQHDLVSSCESTEGEFITLIIAAGDALGYSIDDAPTYLELDVDLAKAYQARTTLFVKAMRDVVAASIGRQVQDVVLKARLVLDSVATKAIPKWSIKFNAYGEVSERVAEVERDLHNFVNLAGAASNALWAGKAADLAPGSKVAEALVKAAKDLRRAAGGKSIARDAEILCAKFRDSIKLPGLIGNPPELDDDSKMEAQIGEIVGFDRNERILHFLIRGHQASTTIKTDMAIFGDLVQEKATEVGNTCKIWIWIKDSVGQPDTAVLKKLSVIGNGIFCQTPDFEDAEVPDDTSEEGCAT